MHFVCKHRERIFEVCAIVSLVDQMRRQMDGVVAIIKSKSDTKSKITDETCAGAILNREYRFLSCRASGTSDRPWDDVSL